MHKTIVHGQYLHISTVILRLFLVTFPFQWVDIQCICWIQPMFYYVSPLIWILWLLWHPCTVCGTESGYANIPWFLIMSTPAELKKENWLLKPLFGTSPILTDPYPDYIIQYTKYFRLYPKYIILHSHIPNLSDPHPSTNLKNRTSAPSLMASCAWNSFVPSRRAPKSFTCSSDSLPILKNSKCLCPFSILYHGGF